MIATKNYSFKNKNLIWDIGKWKPLIRKINLQKIFRNKSKFNPN